MKALCRWCVGPERRGYWRVLFAALTILVTWLTITPDTDSAEEGMMFARWLAELIFGDPEMADKIAHFVAYAVLGAALAFARLPIFGGRLMGVAVLAAYGAGLELVQGLGGVRSMDPLDALANGLGALAGLPGALLLERIAGVSPAGGQPRRPAEA